MDDADFKRLQQQGRIVMARITDMHNAAPKTRPVLILTAPKNNEATETIRVAGGSTQSPVAANIPFAIEVNGTNQPDGHPRTGLRAKTWFYAGWIRTISLGDVERILKFVPETQLLQFHEMIVSLASSPVTDPHREQID